MYLNKLNSFVNKIEKIKEFSEEGKEAFQGVSKGIYLYSNLTNSFLEALQYHNNQKDLISIILLVFFIITILLYCFLAYKKLREVMDIVANVVFFTIPILFVVTGLITVYFMIIFDFCNSVHSGIYKDHFPIYNKGVGKLTNCFDSVINYLFFYLL